MRGLHWGEYARRVLGFPWSVQRPGDQLRLTAAKRRSVVSGLLGGCQARPIQAWLSTAEVSSGLGMCIISAILRPPCFDQCRSAAADSDAAALGRQLPARRLFTDGLFGSWASCQTATTQTTLFSTR